MSTAQVPDVAPAGLSELFLYLWRARWTLVGWMLGGLAIAASWAALARPRFRAQATILIQQQSSSGLLGDLAMLASLASAPATASELSVLESRTLAEGVLADGVDEGGAWDPRDPRRVGLATLVDDEALRPLALVRRRLLDPPPPEVPLVQPERGLEAHVLRAAAGAPSRVRIEFLDSTRVRLSRVGLLQSLHLGARDPEEKAFAPRTPLTYRGLEFELEPWGEWVGASFVLEHLPYHEALKRLRERIGVRETALNSGVIVVTIDDSDPRRAARTVNALCTRYLDSLTLRSKRRASNTVEYVQDLLQKEFARFQVAQDTILGLQQAQPELIAPEGAATNLIEQLSNLEVEHVQLELSRRTFGEIVEALDAGDRTALARIDSTLNVGVLVDPVTSGLLAELAHLEGQASTLESDLLDDHPLRTRNAAASQGLVLRTRAQLASRMEGLASREAELDEVRAELQARLGELPQGLRDLSQPHIDLAIHKELVPYLIKSLQGAEISRSSAETLAEMVDPAVAPDELGAPDLGPLAALWLLAGLGGGMVWIFTRAPKRARLHRTEELAAALGLAHVVGIERLDARDFAFLRARAGATAEAIRRLRGTLCFAPDGSPRRRIGVCQLGGQDEAPLLAAELALAFASEGRRTLLVEALSGAHVSERFELGASPGLAAHLAGESAWQAGVRPSALGPSVLPLGAETREAGDRLAGPRAERFLAQLPDEHELALLALPPAEALLATPGLLRGLDVLCVVHRARSLPRARVAATVRALSAAGVRVLVGVLVEKRP